MDVIQPLSERPKGELLSAPAGDRCATCHSPLASDQRYFVNCGERRGKARFSFATLAAQAAPAPEPAPAPPPRHRVSAGTTLVAGVATLLLALGLGFLMGHLADKNTAQPVRASAATPQVIKIDAGGGGGGGGTTANSGGGNTGGGKAAKKAASSANLSQFKAPPVKVTAKVAQQATQAANKVLGSSAKQSRAGDDAGRTAVLAWRRVPERQVHRAVLRAVKKPPHLGRRRGSRLPGSPDAFGPSRSDVVDLRRRRGQLAAKVAELQWDLGGLVYEMASRDQIRFDVLVRRAAVLQSADAELSEVERILRLEQHGTAGECTSCGAPHSSGAAYCWQCGQPLLAQVPSDSIASA